MIREDKLMPYMLKYENIAWYEDGKVYILDRRIYPIKKEKVICKSYIEVRDAIRNMVTQSAGPYTACAMGMALASYQCKDLSEKERIKYLEDAAITISNARPTTSNRLRKIANSSLNAAKKAMIEGENVTEAIKNDAIKSLNRRYKIMEKVAINLLDSIDGDRILTHCFGETIIGMMGKVAIERGRKLEFFTTETRPFLQGARLTASCLSEMGFKTTSITDNCVAYIMKNNDISAFTTAADTIAMDGHIANKIGTYQNAILAKHFGIPYYVTGIIDRDKLDLASIEIEMRNPKEALEFLGINFTNGKVHGLYPAFDITPPELITKVITPEGAFDPGELSGTSDMRFY